MSLSYALHQQDAIEFLKSQEPESVDCIVTDPAYESLEKHRAHGTTTRLMKKWFPIFKNERFPEFFSECYRILKPNSHLYIYCDDETAYTIKPIGEVAGFKYWKRIVFDKCKIGMGYHYRSRCEYILFFEKGKRKLNNLGMPDVFDLKEDPEGYVIEQQRIMRGFPTEKPVSVSEKLILQSTVEGDVVLDTFMGSGSVGVAALRNNRSFVGVDIEEGAVSLVSKRLEDEIASWQNVEQLKLDI